MSDEPNLTWVKCKSVAGTMRRVLVALRGHRCPNRQLRPRDLLRMRNSQCDRCTFIAAAVDVSWRIYLNGDISPGIRRLQPPVGMRRELSSASVGPNEVIIFCNDKYPEYFKICTAVPVVSRPSLYSRMHQELPLRSGSPMSVRWARKIIQECVQDHSIGWLSDPQALTMPLRLLDLRGLAADGSGVVKLMENLSTSEPPHYVCLSYCWGGDQKIMLQESTRSALVDGIPLLSLPLNFQHIMPFIQQLGYAFLWIDALCIRQDSDKEMATEISRMGGIYESATLTVALASSSNVEDGIFGPIDEEARSVPVRGLRSCSPYR